MQEGIEKSIHKISNKIDIRIKRQVCVYLSRALGVPTKAAKSSSRGGQRRTRRRTGVDWGWRRGSEG